MQKNWIKNEDGSLHIRDWVFSRQRYWGEPFPIAFDENRNIFLIDNLPVELPEIDNIVPSGNGESPLANIDEWLLFENNGVKYRRETNTMPQWAGSSWYYLGYILKNEDGSYLEIDSLEAKERFEKWLPVDIYIGGQEHAVLHLLYARFWHKVLYDLGIVNTKEPFYKVINQGMVLGPDGNKMSKSKGNVINPDEIIEKYGADTLRTYVMFMGPLEDTKLWSDESLHGIKKWLERVVRIFDSCNIGVSKVTGKYHKFIYEVTQLIEDHKFNIVISKMMTFINCLYKEPEISSDEVKGFLVVLSLFAPHISEELLQTKLKEKSVHEQKWPCYVEELIEKELTIVAVQVNGKLRGTLELNQDIKKEEIIKMSKEIDNVKKYIENKSVIKEIFIPNKIINIVVK